MSSADNWMRHLKTPSTYERGILCGLNLGVLFLIREFASRAIYSQRHSFLEIFRVELNQVSQNLSSFTFLLMVLDELVNGCNQDKTRMLLEHIFKIWNVIWNWYWLRFIAHTLSSEDWILCRYLYSRSLEFGVLNDFLFSWLEFWESAFTLGHKDLFYWLISLVWEIFFQKQSTLIVFVWPS